MPPSSTCVTTVREKDQTAQQKHHLSERCCGSVLISNHPKISWVASLQQRTWAHTDHTKKKRKSWLPAQPPPIYLSTQPAESTPQQPNPKHNCKHIPVKWSADILEINWTHIQKPALLPPSHQCTPVSGPEESHFKPDKYKTPFTWGQFCSEFISFALACLFLIITSIRSYTNE